MEAFIVYGGIAIIFLFLFIAFINDRIEREKKAKIIELRGKIRQHMTAMEEVTTLDEKLDEVTQMITFFEELITFESQSVLVRNEYYLAIGRKRGFQAEKVGEELLQKSRGDDVPAADRKRFLDEALRLLIDARERGYGAQHQFTEKIDLLTDLLAMARIDEVMEKGMMAEEDGSLVNAKRHYSEALYRYSHFRRGEPAEIDKKVAWLKERIELITPKDDEDEMQ
ncbi:MAG: hypothetical protein HN826_06745 [Methylococcales bacterium]|nr:hypothetical protein [Methylococcales bacterium]